MVEMLRAVFDSFIRAGIRLFDNRFHPRDDSYEVYRQEILFLRHRNDELISFILSSIRPITAEGDESDNEDNQQLQSIGKPIETTTQRRRRLEAESLANWNKLVQEAREEALSNSAKASIQTTDKLESDLGVKN